jgi:hypothetical protein
MPAVGLAGKTPEAREQLDVRPGEVEEELVVAFIPTGESLSDRLDVLLRQRLLPQAHGFEGFLSSWEPHDPYDLALAERPDSGRVVLELDPAHPSTSAGT